VATTKSFFAPKSLQRETVQAAIQSSLARQVAGRNFSKLRRRFSSLRGNKMSDSSLPTLVMPGVDQAYRQSREGLRAAEIDLRDRVEAVAAMRRALPLGPAVTDYAFIENGNHIRLSELFANGKPYLLLYHIMYWSDDDEFCPMCSLWIDGFNAVAPHVIQRANFVAASRAPFDRLKAWGEHRGWNRLRLLSDDGSSFARDIGAEDVDGDPVSTVVVFAKQGDRVHHVYTAHPMLENRDDGMERGIDLLCPVWHLFDLLPSGRGDWNASNDAFDASLRQGQRA
jgi:predicted dithiol-disulfide oxidoreductase (DUF899 family)